MEMVHEPQLSTNSDAHRGGASASSRTVKPTGDPDSHYEFMAKLENHEVATISSLGDPIRKMIRKEVLVF